MNTKKCKICKSELLLDNFSKYCSRTKYKYNNSCKECYNSKQREKRKNNNEFRKNQNEKCRLYRKNCKTMFKNIIKKLDNERKCLGCQKTPTETVFPLTSYHTYEGNIIKYRSRCRECTAIQTKECNKDNYEKRREYREKNKDRINAVSNLWKSKNPEKVKAYDKKTKSTETSYKKGRIHHCRYIDKIKNYELTNMITFEDLEDLIQQQENKCIYTGLELSWKCNSITQASIDRIDPNKGHSKENCQLVILPINYMKNNLTHRQFDELLYNLENYNENSIVKNYKDWSKKEKCKLTSLISSMKNKTKRVNRQLGHITREEILSLYKKQTNKCALTGLPLSWIPRTWNVASIDRIDSKKGYVRENCQLVISSINYLKHTFTNNDTLEIIKILRPSLK